MIDFLTQYMTDHPLRLIVFFIFVFLWSAIWKGVALYKSGKNEHKGWFIAILVLNTMGILPIIYLLLNREDRY